MKRTLLALTLVLMLLLGLCVTASASDFDAAAQELSEIGMFRGTGTGFDLDRAPTRAEAAVMLTRLFGAEQKAAKLYKAGEISHPFTDVPDYAAPSVAWLYARGLTKGMSAVSFGASRACSLQDYTVFLLRALGYQDGTDFSYPDALQFAQKAGFYNPAVYTGPFLRDDLAGLTYDALGADVKDGSTYLLASLVDAGAVEKTQAAELSKKLEAFRALCKASQSLDMTAADMDYTLEMGLFEPGADETITLYADGNVKYRLASLDMDYTVNLRMEQEHENLHLWMKDGVCYVEQNGEKYRMDLASEWNLPQLRAMLAELPAKTDSYLSGLSYVNDIQLTTAGGESVYTMRIPAKSMMDLTDAALRQSKMRTQDLGLTFTKDLVLRYTVSGGKLTKISAELSMTFSDVAYMQDGSGKDVSFTYEAGCDLSIDMTIRKTGKDVTIIFPDLTSFRKTDFAVPAGG